MSTPASPSESTDTRPSFVAFYGEAGLTRGSAAIVAAALCALPDRGSAALIFDEASGRAVDWDMRGEVAEIVARLSPHPASSGDVPEETADAAGGRGRGRPKLGVVAREVTLLPRHWDWLAAQPGGASVTLRRLVDEARRKDNRAAPIRATRDALYGVLSAVAGDRPHFEDAARALFAGDRSTFERLIAAWPDSIRGYAHARAADAFPET